MSAPLPAASTEAGPARLVATLTLAGLLSGTLIVGAYQITLPAIEAHKAAALKAAVLHVVPGSASLQPLAWTESGLVPGEPGPEAVYAANDEAGQLVGYAVPAEGAGFQDTVKLIYGYNPTTHKVIGLQVLESRETPGLGDKIIKDADFLHNFDDLSVEPRPVVVGKGKKVAPHEVEAITGATISSKAVTRILGNTQATWGPRLDGSPAGSAQ